MAPVSKLTCLVDVRYSSPGTRQNVVDGSHLLFEDPNNSINYEVKILSSMLSNGQ